MPGAEYRRVPQVCVERLEPRALLSAGDPVVQSLFAPTVAGALLGGTQWSSEFKQYLEQIGGGDADYGTSWFGPTTAPVSWVNVNQVTIRFSRNLVVEARHLRVLGTNVSEYPVESFRYTFDAPSQTGVAVWTLGRPLGPDSILLEVDGDAPQGVRTGTAAISSMATGTVGQEAISGSGSSRCRATAGHAPLTRAT